VTACTIVARNYLAHARVLARSYAAHHDGERLAVLVVDAEVGPPLRSADEPFDVIRPSELPLDPVEYRRMATIYDVMELSTAVKPWLLQLLLDRGAPSALYLDPDIEIFAPLIDLGPLAAQHGIVLIPHTLAPIPEDGKKPTPQDIADAGVYNLGFIAVGPAARPFLVWWGERLRRDCIVSIEEGLFVDQRLLDVVPGYYGHVILRDPTLNVAYWNLHERRIRWANGRYEVSGQPLRFFHFSGFDPDKPDRLSKHQGDRPRTDLSREPDLARLCRHYAEQLRAAGYDDARQTEYGYGRIADGIPLDRRMRRLYRHALLAADRGAPLEAPDPFDPAKSAGFVKWLAAPGTQSKLPLRAQILARIESGPAIGSKNLMVRLMQRALLRALRPLTDHDRQVTVALLELLDVEKNSPDGPTGRRPA
jgi:hypothetical protein